MKITKNLPQFNGQNHLVAVASNHEAKFFTAADGSIHEISSFSIEDDSYTDKENASMSHSAKGVTTITGSLRETLRQKNLKAFEKKFIESIKEHLKKVSYSSASLFIPRQGKRLLASLIPREIQDKITKTVYGNYIHEHPFALLEKLSDSPTKSGATPGESQFAFKDRLLRGLGNSGKQATA